MIGLLRRYEVWFFLCLIPLVNFAFVAIIEAIDAMAPGLLPVAVFSLGRFLLLGLILFVVVYVSRGMGGIWDALGPMRNLRFNYLYLIPAALWSVGIALAVLAVKALVTGAGLSVFEFNFARAMQRGMIAVVIVSSFIGEIVWISYAIVQLSKRMSLFVATVIVGVFWMIWWLPFVYFERGVIPDLPLLPLLLNQIGVACACAFFYYKTRSGLCILIMQIVLNFVLVAVPIAPQTGGIATYTGFALTYFVISAGALAIWGPRPLLGRAQA